VSVFCLGPEQLDGLWDEIAPHLARFESERGFSSADIRRDLASTAKQLWGYEVGGRVIGVCVTQVCKPVVEIFAAVGTQTSNGQIQEVHAAIERWAREIGCTRLRIKGRKGWLRMLDGYEMILEKELA